MTAIQRSASVDFKNELFPRVGELWDCDGRVAIIADNTVEEGKAMWVMDWATGDTANVGLASLTERPDRFSIDNDTLEARFTEWARAGIPAAMWFLGWWFEVVNHQRSIWYYVAAMRAGPNEYKWAYSRIVADARDPITATRDSDGNTTHYPMPDLGFLRNIPEMNVAKLYCSLWAEAVAQAEKAPNVEPLAADKVQ